LGISLRRVCLDYDIRNDSLLSLSSLETWAILRFLLLQDQRSGRSVRSKGFKLSKLYNLLRRSSSVYGAESAKSKSRSEATDRAHVHPLASSLGLAAQPRAEATNTWVSYMSWLSSSSPPSVRDSVNRQVEDIHAVNSGIIQNNWANGRVHGWVYELEAESSRV
jgi:hypothetical protein